MKKTHALSFFTAISLLIAKSALAANITITFASAATAVPSVSGVMLFILSLLLAAVGLRVLKQNQGSVTMLLGFIAVSALISGTSGIKLISDANALIIFPPIGYTVANITGSNTTSYDNSPDTLLFQNTSGSQQIIASITSNDQSCDSFSLGYDVGPFPPINSALPPVAANGSPHCEAGLTIPAGAYCYIFCNANVG